MGKTEAELVEVHREFAGVSLPDRRLDERLSRIVSLLEAAPDESFPEQMESEADQEALYRFLANPKVTMEAILSGHVAQTQERIARCEMVRVLHDTSSFRFDGQREGLGVLRAGTKGFFGHFALVVAADESREPLGVLGLRPYVREETEQRRKLTRSQRIAASQTKPRAKKESSRWERLAIDVDSLVPRHVRAIHVMDQEADDYTVLGELHRAGVSFVIRVIPQRRTQDGPLADVLSKSPSTLFRTVALNPRSQSKAIVTKHPARTERNATLHIRWGTINLARTYYAETDVPELSLSAVHVFESDPPPGEAPIEWMLITSETVSSLEDAAGIVDHYRARWVIEEYFKALKTGCAFEKRQLMTYEGLLRALAIFVPLAWRLLLLRHFGRDAEVRPATAVFDVEQLLLLRLLLERKRRSLPEKPTVRDAMLAIAALGGHIKNNGDPGWLTLGRGYSKFAEAELGWRLARRCDQS